MGRETLDTIKFECGFINDGRSSDPELWTVLRADVKDGDGEVVSYVVDKWIPGQLSDDVIKETAETELIAWRNLGQPVSNFTLTSTSLRELQEDGIIPRTSVLFIE